MMAEGMPSGDIWPNMGQLEVLLYKLRNRAKNEIKFLGGQDYNMQPQGFWATML